MNARYDDLQAEYVADLRKVLPPVMAWWKEHAGRGPEKMQDAKSLNSFEQRWPMGPVAHPRVLEVVRIYYLRILELNRENETNKQPDAAPEEGDWGSDDDSDDVDFALPVDLLVNDLKTAAPDLFEIMTFLVFVPVGLSPGGEYC
ncbi:hypothetical protein [Mesorhizobium sophorae]|uniref:hypothetical protein n=1 Tax=Mesorhizobium sophorae TaxID=1300294 RepID=UPI000BA38ECE|nr:hypothetical protein [Mesorhizobium sophorae]